MPLNHSLSRRRFVTNTVALASTLQLQRAALAMGLAPSDDLCKLMPEQEVGPYYVPGELLRSNIVEDKPGVPLTLRIAVLDSRTCRPLPNAAIDIWQCDALGLYSGYTKQNPMGFGGPGDHHEPPPGADPAHPGNRPGPPEGFGPPPENHPTDKLTFLRGIQITDASGAVNFQTIFPGFYMGRTNHVHFKVRLGGDATNHTYEAGHTSHVGQVFFPEEVATAMMALEPYSKHAIHRTTQAEDEVFTGQHGEVCLASLRYIDPSNPTAGLRAQLVAEVDPSATPGPAERSDGR